MLPVVERRRLMAITVAAFEEVSGGDSIGVCEGVCWRLLVVYGYLSNTRGSGFRTCFPPSHTSLNARAVVP
ncbi:hypothetical protein Hanom_Chr16g01485621 [Helianthus anomalus]